MKRLFASIALSMLIAGCSNDSAEKIGTELVTAKRDLVKVIGGVTDEASAQAAAPQIQAVYARMAQLTKRAAGLPDAPKNVADRLDNETMAADEEMHKALAALKGKDPGAEKVLRGIINAEMRKLPNP
jgi:hypothetical protein